MTLPFGATLESALKQKIQGGKLRVYKDIIVSPEFHCCLSGLNVPKDPVAVMGVSPTRVCTGTNVSVDYSHSYSPSSTIATWEIDWGDGNTTGAAWPGAGSSNHPAGGYALPGYYTITLTVIDLLGAYGYAQQQVEVIDCLLPEIEMFGGCGASGVWKTETAGINWDTSGLDGILIYDLKPTWFSVGTESVELWAATENGLYHTIDNGLTWGHIALPLPGGFTVVTLSTVALTCSKYDAAEVHVLAEIAALQHVYIYHTVDRGETWEYKQIGIGEFTDLDGGLNNDVLAMHWDSSTNRMYVGGWCWFPTGVEAFNRAGYWDGTDWNAVGDGVDDIVQAIAESPDGNIWLGGVFENSGATPMHQVARWNGISLSAVGTIPITDGVEALAYWNGHMYAAGIGVGAGINSIYYWRGATWTQPGAFIDGWVHALAAGDYLYAGGDFADVGGDTDMSRVARWDGVQWYEMDGGANADVRALAVAPDGTLFAGGDFTIIGDVAPRYIAFWQNNKWHTMEAGGDRLNGIVRAIAIAEDGTVYIGGDFTGTVGGKTLNHIARWDSLNQEWRAVGTGTNGNVWSLEIDEYGILWAGGEFTQADGNVVNYIARRASGDAVLPTVGTTHIIDMDASGWYVYVALLNVTGEPAIIRVSYDLSTSETMYNPGTGTWGGVVCDPYTPQTLWLFGNYGAGKVLLSQDWGKTFTDITDAGWGAGELVRPLLLSLWEPNNAIAILNVANEVWQTKDYATWVEIGATAFTADCGARDPFEPNNIWIGRVAPGGANHIQYSPNEGRSWIEHSGGFEPNAPVTALAVTK